MILGGMMAVDLGGPINKVAYTFAVAAIDAGNFYPMAAVMAGGIVPPLGIALATTLFHKKFTEDQKTIREFKLQKCGENTSVQKKRYQKSKNRQNIIRWDYFIQFRSQL